MDRQLKGEGMKPLDRFTLGAVCVVLALIFTYLSLFCLLHTSIFNPKNIIFEHVLRVRDPVLLNLALALCLALLLRLFLRFEKALSLRWCTGIFLGLVFVVGAVWMGSLSALPRADSWGCYNAGVQLAFGQPLSSPDYFQRYPFQAGYTFYCEVFVHLFGEYSTPKIGYVNALLLALSYAALLTLLWDSQHNKRIQLCGIGLLALLIQPLFYVTFIYGIVPGLALSLWAVALTHRWIRQKRWWQLPLAAALCAAAIVLKPNYWIVALAIFLMLLLYCISARQFRWLPMALLVILMPMAAVSGVQRAFESRIHESLGAGTPQAAWLAMGLQEGSRAAGWYNSYTGMSLDLHTLDHDAAHRQALADIRARLQVFAGDPAYGLSFFHNKMVSQWGETTFESIWVNKTLRFTQDPAPVVQSILTGNAATALERYMDGFTILLYLAFALGLLLWRFGKSNRERSWAQDFGPGVLAVVILGGWLYHMLFEAKSQYLVIYLPMMIPFAAMALASRFHPSKAPPRPRGPFAKKS